MNTKEPNSRTKIRAHSCNTKGHTSWNMRNPSHAARYTFHTRFTSQAPKLRTAFIRLLFHLAHVEQSDRSIPETSGSESLVAEAESNSGLVMNVCSSLDESSSFGHFILPMKQAIDK
ncbi:hypothetical protein PMIN06_000189 [Paraphaeosphaeria minitans]